MRIVDISLEICTLLKGKSEFMKILKTFSVRIRRGRTQICLSLVLSIFHGESPKPWIQGTILEIFELPAGEVLKEWKNELLVWEVSQSVKILLPRWVRIKEKNDSHAAWECSNQFLRHLSHENVSSVNGWFFDYVKIGDFWCVKKCVKREGQQDYSFLVRFW